MDPMSFYAGLMSGVFVGVVLIMAVALLFKGGKK